MAQQFDPLIEALLASYTKEEDPYYVSGKGLMKQEAPMIGKLGDDGVKGFLGAFLPGLLQKSAGGFLAGIGEGRAKKQRSGMLSEYGQYSQLPEEEQPGFVEKSEYLQEISPAIEAQKLKDQQDAKTMEDAIRQIEAKESAKAKNRPLTLKPIPIGDSLVTINTATGEKFAEAPRYKPQEAAKEATILERRMLERQTEVDKFIPAASQVLETIKKLSIASPNESIAEAVARGVKSGILKSLLLTLILMPILGLLFFVLINFIMTLQNN